MKTQFLFCVLFLQAMFILATTTADAQNSSMIWLNVDYYYLENSTPHTATDNYYFGNYTGATPCLDSLSPTIVEQECVDINGAWSTCGKHLCIYDFRGIPVSRAKPDTFRLSFINWTVPGAYGSVVRWPDATYLHSRCDSMFLVRAILTDSGTIVRDTTDMFRTDSLVADPKGTSFRIYKYGCALVDGVTDETESVPASYSLDQNTPNPFNPSTTISFSLPAGSDTRLRIYNVLGEEVALLIMGFRQAGHQSVEWNAAGRPSGIYFYKIEATSVSDGRRFTDLKKMVLIR
jgi:hypothetical protein